MAPSLVEVLCISVILALPFLYETNNAFRYYFKFCLYYVLVMTIALFVIPIMAFHPGDVTNLILASAVCRPISRLIGLRWTFRGGDYLAEDKAYVIVSNHQSSLDILGLFEIWPLMRKCTVVAKKELLYAWPFGLACWLCGLVFIDRLNSEAARATLNEACAKAKQQRIKLWVFPEGTRRNTGEIHPFKKGAFHIAIQGQIPIQPVVFSPYYFLDDKSHTFDGGKIIMSALPPISTEGLTEADIDGLVTQVQGVMKDELARLTKEVKSNLPPPLQPASRTPTWTVK